jgi:hypothetical protein
MSREARTREVGPGCLIVFALPFVAVGVLLLARAVRDLIAGADLRAIALPGLAGVAFGVAGTAIVALGLAARRRHDESEALRARHPEQPWLWDPQWARGRLESSDRSSLAGAWALTVFWNTVSSVVFLIVPEELQKGNKAALLAMLFPLAGVGLLLWAVRATIRWRRFGTSTLELATNPVPLGGVLRARLVTRLDPPPETIRLVLTCVRRDHTADNTSDQIVWLEERLVRSDEMRREVEGTVVPVAFALPADAPPTERNVLGQSIHWKLNAEAAVAGVDYRSRFELPVFRVDDAAPVPELATRGFASRPVSKNAGASSFDPAQASVRVQPATHGHEFYFGPGRNPGAAASFGVMAGIFFAATYGLDRLGVPLIFVGVCGAFALLMLLILLNVWLGTSRVQITNDQVLVRKSLLGIGTTTRIPLRDVRDVNLHMGMSQAETAVQSPRAWYDIKLQRSNGRRITLGSNIANKREAEWLVEEIRARING